MNTFQIDGTEFGVGEIQFSVADHLLNLEISGDEGIFDGLSEEDDSQWGWALYPPQIYFHDVPFTGEKIVIDREFLNHNEIALYMMEHYDFTGELKLTDGSIEIRGQVDMDGDRFPVVINVERKDIS